MAYKTYFNDGYNKAEVNNYIEDLDAAQEWVAERFAQYVYWDYRDRTAEAHTFDPKWRGDFVAKWSHPLEGTLHLEAEIIDLDLCK